MRHMRNLGDYRWAFDDLEYVERTLRRIAGRCSSGVNGCRIISGHKDGKGYARIGFAGTTWLAHRLVWLLNNGPIGELVIDHPCRQPDCVNIDHLEPVPNRVNVMRGASAFGSGICPNGHKVERHGKNRGCATCKNDRQRARYKAA